MTGGLLVWAWLGRAEACSTCACRDPTIVTVGTDAPRQGATRVAVSASYRTEREGSGASARATSEARAALAVAHAPAPWLDLVAELPLVARSLVHPNLARERTLAPGDLEATARAVVWSADRAALGPLAGARLPTGPSLAGADLDVQPGPGRWGGLAGVWARAASDTWLGYASATLLAETAGRDGGRPPSTWRATGLVQWQPRVAWAARASVESRLAEGGPALFAGPGWVLRPGGDLTVQAAVSLPVVRPAPLEGPVSRLAVQLGG